MAIEDVGPELNDSQIDALVGDGVTSEPAGDTFPMESPAVANTIAPAQGAQGAQASKEGAVTQTGQDKFVITHNGKQIEASLDQLKQWAQMGYDYPQRMQAVKQQQAQFENQWKIYKEIDEYAKQNPDWWSHVDQSWKTKGNLTQPTSAQLDPNNPLAQAYQGLLAEVNDLKGFKDSFVQKEMLAKRQADDEALVKDVSSMREQFKHLDWNTPDPRGYNLEMQVLAYAQEKGIQSFPEAFKLYNYDKLMSLAEERGKESVVKDHQKKTKLGLLSQGSAPKGNLSPARSIKDKSYSDLANEALAELGISAG